jgi:hypothetical protein
MPEPTAPICVDRDRRSTETDKIGLTGLCVVGAAGAILNWNVVTGLARAAGYSPALCFLYWFLLDAFGVVAMRSAFRARTTRVRRQAAATAVFSLLVAAGAAGAHVAITDGTLPGWLAVLVLVLPAIQVGLAWYLVHLLRLETRVDHGDAVMVQTEMEIAESAFGRQLPVDAKLRRGRAGRLSFGLRWGRSTEATSGTTPRSRQT